MSYDDLILTPLCSRYSKKMSQKITSARNYGCFTPEDAHGRGVRSVVGHAGFVVEGNAVAIYWLIDEADGVIADAKFQVFGQSPLIAAADAACELCVGKTYAQARRISAELVDKKLRDQPDIPAFPEETYSHLNLIIEALEDAAEKCSDILLSEILSSPVPQTNDGTGYPGWLSLTHEKKLAVIEEILNIEVRPYVELDAGGIEVQALINDKELIIAYKGACTSCFSAIGATLSTIQQIVQTKVHPDIVVVPNMDALSL